jgi:hypothetical protein
MSLKAAVKGIIQKIPPLERLRQLHKHTTVSTRSYSREIRRWFKNTAVSESTFNRKRKIDNLIVSLTSFPARINVLEYALFSLIRQTVRPEKIVLWLSEQEFPHVRDDIPAGLARYSIFNVEIQFTKENYRSYKKLVYSLKEYPDALIVTADDDIFYKSDWLELLVKTHEKFPDDIIAHRAKWINFIEKKIAPYNEWMPSNIDVSYCNFLTTGGGVLFPPNSLYPDALNNKLFMELCPFADDIWFYVMALLQKTKIRTVKNGYHGIISFDYIFKRAGRKIPQLMDINVGNNQNDVQFAAVLRHYAIYDSFYELFGDTTE